MRYLPQQLTSYKDCIVYNPLGAKKLEDILEHSRAISNSISSEDIDAARIATVNYNIKKNGVKPRADHTFVFYYIPSEVSILNTFDMPRTDCPTWRYIDVLKMAISYIRKAVCEAEIAIITTEDIERLIDDHLITIINMDLDPLTPMYSRVRAYNTLVQDGFLGRCIYLLDTDVIVLRDITKVFSSDSSSVALTYRYSPGLMPINEGVIMVKPDSPFSKHFFGLYLSAYEILMSDKEVLEVYPQLNLGVEGSFL